MTDENNQPQDSGTSAGEGLLDNVSIDNPDVANQDNPQKTEISHLAPQDDDSPLERPDWWPENFWKKDEAEPDLEAIAKSWSDLRKQISQGKHKAPEDGNYDLSSFGDTPDDDPVRNHVASWAKEYNVSQAALDALVGPVIAMGDDTQKQVKFNAEAERKALGPNAEATIKGITQWAAGLVQKGIWGQDDFEEFKVMGGTAKGIMALNKLRDAYEGRIPTQSAPVEGLPSKDELYGMVNDPRYKTDPSYRQKVERMFSQAFA